MPAAAQLFRLSGGYRCPLCSRSIFLHVSGLSKAHVAWSRNGDGPSDGMILLMKATLALGVDGHLG